jgi:hypothetical protein
MSRAVWFQVIVHDDKGGGDAASAAFVEYMGGKTPHRLHVTHGCRAVSFRAAQELGAAARQVLDQGDELVFATRLEDDGPEHVHGWMFCGWDRR